MLEFALSQETARTAPLLPPEEGWEENLLFRFVSGTHLLKERAISYSSGFSSPWDDSVRRPASSLSPTNHFASIQESTVRGRHSSPRTSGQSRSGPREFGGWRRMNPSRPPLVPSWDLSIVLAGLQRGPFEPLDSVELKFLSLKTALSLPSNGSGTSRRFR